MTLDDYAALSRKRRASMGLPSWGEPTERSRCGEPHPHYSSMSCGREPGHDDAHSYGVPSTQPTVQDHTDGSEG